MTLFDDYANLSNEQLIQLTNTMTARCFLSKPVCSECAEIGTITCPPTVAYNILRDRGIKL